MSARIIDGKAFARQPASDHVSDVALVLNQK